MRILQRLLILSVLLPLAACDGGTLPATDPIHGTWSTPIDLFLGTGDIDRAEHRYTFSPDGTYESTTVGYERAGSGWRVVYEGEMRGQYRLEAGGVARNVKSYRWRGEDSPRWQNELVSDQESFGPPMRYTLDDDRLIMHHGPYVGEHGQPFPAEDKVYTRRR